MKLRDVDWGSPTSSEELVLVCALGLVVLYAVATAGFGSGAAVVCGAGAAVCAVVGLAWERSRLGITQPVDHVDDERSGTGPDSEDEDLW